MNKVVEILMNRDGMSQEEAQNLLDEVRDMIEDAEHSPNEVEDIIQGELGLELDYVFDILL